MNRRQPGTVSRNRRTPVSELREELMPLPFPFRKVVLAAALFALASVTSSAQDKTAAAEEAEKQRADIQKQLSEGTDIQKRFRVDKFEDADGQVKITGVFLDTPATQADQKVAFDVLQDEVGELIRKRLKAPGLKFEWKTGITRVEDTKHPHVILQNAANAAGAKGEAGADQFKFDGSHFGADGKLVISGIRGKDEALAKWLSAAIATHLEKHPAVRTVGGKPVVVDQVKPVEWKLSAGEIQKVLAASPKSAIRRLRADRAYFAYENEKPDGTGKVTGLRCVVSGVRLGEDDIDLIGLQESCSKQWPEVLAGPNRVRITVDFGPSLVEPFAQLQAAIATKPALDGVRVDSGGEFSEKGELMLAGIQPGLTAEGLKELTAVYQSVLKDLIDKGDAAAQRYKRLSTSPVSTQKTKLVQTGWMLMELREWAAGNLDDVRMPRLYFDAKGGLTLQCQTVTKADAEKVDAKFKELTKQYLPEAAPPEPESQSFRA